MIVECPANTRLQNWLLSQGIHILTACGGRGNCGKCAVRVLAGEAGEHPVEITTFREDGAYSDGRHPDGVRFVSSVEDDLARRGQDGRAENDPQNRRSARGTYGRRAVWL